MPRAQALVLDQALLIKKKTPDACKYHILTIYLL